MEVEAIKQKGNLNSLTTLINDLNTLHLAMLSDTNNYKHAELERWAKPYIEEFKMLSKTTSDNDVEVCINALYTLFLLRLQKKEISDNTMMAMQTFSNLLANIALIYNLLNEHTKQ
jgi:hypothetical protein